MEFSHLTGGEEHLMQLLWQLQSFYLKDVIEQHPEPKPHQNTVSTYLKILADKNFLTAEKQGRILKYDVSVSREDYKRFLLKNLIGNYGFSSKELLYFLVSEKYINPEDFAEFFRAKITVEANAEILDKNFKTKAFFSKLKKSKKSKKHKK